MSVRLKLNCANLNVAAFKTPLFSPLGKGGIKGGSFACDLKVIALKIKSDFVSTYVKFLGNLVLTHTFLTSKPDTSEFNQCFAKFQAKADVIQYLISNNNAECGLPDD